MAGYPVAAIVLLEFRGVLLAVRFCDWAPGMEVTSKGRIDRTGYIAGKLDSCFAAPFVHLWNCRQKALGIGMPRIVGDLCRRTQFYQFAQVHDTYPVTDMGDNRQIMRDEKIGESQFLLKIIQQIEYLNLD